MHHIIMPVHENFCVALPLSYTHPIHNGCVIQGIREYGHWAFLAPLLTRSYACDCCKNCHICRKSSRTQQTFLTQKLQINEEFTVILLDLTQWRNTSKNAALSTLRITISCLKVKHISRRGIQPRIRVQEQLALACIPCWASSTLSPEFNPNLLSSTRSRNSGVYLGFLQLCQRGFKQTVMRSVPTH